MQEYLGKDIPKLGFGLMRPPMIGEDVDMEQLARMVDLFMEKGFSYFDTAWGYLNGKSELAAREVLVERYPRERFQFATKLPAWAVSTAEEAKNMFRTSLDRTGLEFFDFYLLHNLGGTGNVRTETFDRFGIWDFLAEQKREGRIRHLGFSMHAKAAHLDEVLSKHPEMDFVQLQINYADWENPVIESRKCYETAMKHGKPVVIMEPVKGGALANLPEPAAEIFSRAEPGRSQASWALRYAASLEGIVTVLSGMSTVDQMKDNLSVMENFRPLNKEERTVIERVQQALSAIPQVPCTDCRYCLKGCPEHISIPGVFAAVNDYLVYRNMARAKSRYGFETASGGKASACIRCGACEEVCPQGIPIIAELAKAAEIFGM
ncbi:aldo/keto reductase [Breznakiella homolactica]|uniref:Aldo/keto reductase n=1 Tax=Breznakiella homolactica TaxID=2798577 RepID=A0A7T8BA58_9SPIR|nr:aldo/keto reductase [Breznakiella homolactica]QQO07893.1 aldo/keto reductase [Breznakiella homolactica]